MPAVVTVFRSEPRFRSRYLHPPSLYEFIIAAKLGKFPMIYVFKRTMPLPPCPAVLMVYHQLTRVVRPASASEEKPIILVKLPDFKIALSGAEREQFAV